MWRNWVGNQTCEPERIAAPASEDEVCELVAGARSVRAAGAGHSFTPVVVTDGLLLDLGRLPRIRALDPASGRVVCGPATTIGEFGEPLLAAGLALANQGDIVAQQIAGAVSTATHGSGLGYGSFAGSVRRLRIVTAAGEVVEVDGGDALHAAQVAVGMLGVVTELELQAVPAYRLREHVANWSWEAAWEPFEELARAHRHFSFFWMPSAASAVLYGLDAGADECHVKIYDEVGDDVPDSDVRYARVGPAHRIYPMVYEPNFHELEYFVPFERGKEALAAMRELMLARLPVSVFPMEVRTVGRESAWLSHSYERETVVISVSGTPGEDYWPYLREVDALLGGFDARVHWGKLHFLTREQLFERYPRAAEFVELRRTYDPEGVFLNDHLRPLFA
ncbi:MAG TPA: D-arabinono-1,4-lactone oxidase [Gaiellaceae bacterium]|nr:D-arabinono-1,4-lactone oxidase [Gaiellaceae bacterium]